MRRGCLPPGVDRRRSRPLRQINDTRLRSRFTPAMRTTLTPRRHSRRLRHRDGAALYELPDGRPVRAGRRGGALPALAVRARRDDAALALRARALLPGAVLVLRLPHQRAQRRRPHRPLRAPAGAGGGPCRRGDAEQGSRRASAFRRRHAHHPRAGGLRRRHRAAEGELPLRAGRGDRGPRSTRARSRRRWPRRSRGAGVNRVSLGVQDVDPQVQALVNRIQPTEQVAEAVALLRAERHRAHQRRPYVRPADPDGRARARHRGGRARPRARPRGGVRLRPRGRGSPSTRRRSTRRCCPVRPSGLAQAQAASEAFAQAGWVEVGFDHYATPDDPLAVAVREGTLERNFQGYTTDTAETLIGFGASAIGALPAGYAQNEPHLGKWAQAIDEGSHPGGARRHGHGGGRAAPRRHLRADERLRRRLRRARDGARVCGGLLRRRRLERPRPARIKYYGQWEIVARQRAVPPQRGGGVTVPAQRALPCPKRRRAPRRPLGARRRRGHSRAV